MPIALIGSVSLSSIGEQYKSKPIACNHGLVITVNKRAPQAECKGRPISLYGNHANGGIKHHIHIISNQLRYEIMTTLSIHRVTEVKLGKADLHQLKRDLQYFSRTILIRTENGNFEINLYSDQGAALLDEI